MTINFYLDSKQNSKEEKSIYCFVRGLARGKTIQINTGKKINPKYWNKTKQSVRVGFDGSQEFNAYLADFASEINKCHSIHTTQNKNITFEEMKSEFLKIFNKEEKKNGFFDIFTLFLESKSSSYSASSKQKYLTLMKVLKAFESSKKFSVNFNSIDLKFYDKFTQYLLIDKKLTNNTVSKNIDNLKTFLKWAYDRNYNHKNDFTRFQSMEESVEIIYLTESELMSLYKFDFSDKPIYDAIRDVFCFACFTGQRFSDVSNLKRDDIREGEWHLRTTKTKDILNIPLNEFALEIIDKYKESDKILPTYPAEFTNDELKNVCKAVGIDAPITKYQYRGAERIEKNAP